MASNLETVLAAAAAKASELVASVPAVQGTGSTGVAVQAARNLTLDDILDGDLAVDDWLKVSYFGMTMKSAPEALFKELVIEIDVNDIAFSKMMKYTVNGQPKYIRSRDGINAVGGGSWADAIAQGERLSGKEAQVYTAADLPMTVVDDFSVGGNVIIEGGTVVGHTTSTTNFRYLKPFLKEVAKKGLTGQPVRVKIGHEAKADKGFKWGVITFTLLGPVEELAQAA